MRLGGYRSSTNVSQGGGGGGGGFGFGGGGGGGGCLFALLPMIMSRFGIGGVLILLLGYCALSTLGGGGGSLGLGGGGTSVAPQPAGGSAASTQEICSTDPSRTFSCRVLASTEDTWEALFKARGQAYQPAGLRFYTGTDRSGCGAAQSAMGPFYCPGDSKIYLDTSFFNELQTKFRAAGDFAQAYVIAHEVGHHLQNLDGTLASAQREQRRLSTREGNALQVKVELQADCYAGVWAANARDAQGSLMEAGDLEEGLTAAAAIGDDTLQQQSQGRVRPESFTHGSAAQRQQWLRRGLESGDPAACDTFGSPA